MRALLIRVTVFLLITVLPAAHGAGLQLDDILGEQTNLDSSVPTPKTVMGIAVGERHWYHHEIIRYLDTLAAVSPRMVALGAHATSYGGRSLVSYAISSEANIARLEAIQAARADLINPDKPVDLASQPAVMHMMYSIHGNEPSGSNATPLVAYYLNASQDAKLKAQLEDVVIIFNPMLNPDGLDRFAQWSNNHRGKNPSPDSNDREHREATPNGRTNYYGFDLNRDWLPHQHPESRGRLALFHAWKPNVQLDFHEQGSNSNFFFMPGKPERTNPLTPAINQTLTARIGDYHARAFDEAGILYFSGEGYDDFFMGKGSTYPDLFGCVGILFEQPSSRGAQQDVVNGRLTFPDSIANQFRASLSSIEATSALKDELLTYQRNFYVQRKAASGHFLASAEGDPTRLREFVRLLRGHDIEVEVLSKEFTAGKQRFAAHTTLAIPLDQPQSTYLQTLWNAQLTFEENVFYDVSTWTMPWAFDLDHTRTAVRGARTQPLPDDFLRTSKTLPTSRIGYLIDWRDSDAPALLYDLLEMGANVRVAQKPFSAKTVDAGEVDFGYGTLLVSGEIGKAIPALAITRLQQAAAEGLAVFSVASSLTATGIDLGSRDFHVLSLPKVALVTGPGTAAYDTGEIWHLLDQRVDMPITMIDSYRVASTDLSSYSHIILTNPLRLLSDRAIGTLKSFVEGGGVLWAQGAATIDWLAKEGLTSVVWRQTQAQQNQGELSNLMAEETIDTTAVASLLPERRPFAAAQDEAAFKLVRGAILEGNLDISHPLGYGYQDTQLPMFRRNARFMERAVNAYSSPVVYTDTPLLSGYMSAENQALVGGSASVVVDAMGDGAMVLGLDVSTFRAFWWGSQRLLVNAVFFGELLEAPR